MRVDPDTLPTVRPKMVDVPEDVLEAIRVIASFLAGSRAPTHEIVCISQLPQPKKFRSLINKGALPAAKLGRDYLVRMADVIRWMDAHPVEPRPRKCAAANDDVLDVTREVAASAGLHVKRRSR